MMPAGTRKPFLDPEGLVHWPVLFFYPENMQSDAVEDFCEAETLADHLDVMFGPSSPPLEWDTDRLYTRSQLRLYYLSHAASPLKPDQLAQVGAAHPVLISRMAVGCMSHLRCSALPSHQVHLGMIC